jgi:hypothetical protein
METLMITQKIVDKDGILWTNTSRYNMVDYSTDTLFGPGETIRIKPNKWLESQPVFSKEKLTEPVKVAK